MQAIFEFGKIVIVTLIFSDVSTIILSFLSSSRLKDLSVALLIT